SGQRHVYDLSDRKLTLLPETLLCSAPPDIQQLNLRRNSLLIRSSNDATTAQVGWLDDLTRLVSLTSLDLSSNRLSTFPLSITELINLRKLNMASNCIQTVPPNVRLLKRLTSLDLENNWISLLPPQLADCDQLIWLNLKFNRIKQVPEEILLRLPHLIEWSLAGNYIESVTTDQQTLINTIGTVEAQPAELSASPLDLRRTSLCGCFRLPSSCFDQLTFLDIRDNCNVSTVHLTNMPSLQYAVDQ
ncbi:leucine Rich repeat-containing domain protein, partial [Necator americanus]